MGGGGRCRGGCRRHLLHAPLYGFYLENTGWFVAKIACYYCTDDGVTWQESDHTDGIAIWTAESTTLDDLGVPMYALVKIHVIVVGGKDRTGSEVFIPIAGKVNTTESILFRAQLGTLSWNMKSIISRLETTLMM